MTPARKVALQWFYDRGEAVFADVLPRGAPTLTMRDRMEREGQLQQIRYDECGPIFFALTDKGRRDLHEAGR